MYRKYRGGAWFSIEEEEMLERLNERYPEFLEFNVEGQVSLLEDTESLAVDELDMVLEPGEAGKGPDIVVRKKRSGDDVSSISADLAETERFFDALSFEQLGKHIQVTPRGVISHRLRISGGLEQKHVDKALLVLERWQGHGRRNVLDRVFAWYRESWLASSLFNQYSMLWNALEVLVRDYEDEAGKPKGERLAEVKEYLESKMEQLELKHVYHAYNEIARMSIPSEMKRGFHALLGQDAERAIDLCFDRKPKESRLYQIRNDINHGAITERNEEEVDRVVEGLNPLADITFNALSSALGLGWGLRLSDD